MMPSCRCWHLVDVGTREFPRCALNTCGHGYTPEKDCMMRASDGRVWCKTEKPEKEGRWGERDAG